jgi:hypothetical protein
MTGDLLVVLHSIRQPPPSVHLITKKKTGDARSRPQLWQRSLFRVEIIALDGFDDLAGGVWRRLDGTVAPVIPPPPLSGGTGPAPRATTRGSVSTTSADRQAALSRADRGDDASFVGTWRRPPSKLKAAIRKRILEGGRRGRPRRAVRRTSSATRRRPPRRHHRGRAFQRNQAGRGFTPEPPPVFDDPPADDPAKDDRPTPAITDQSYS